MRPGHSYKRWEPKDLHEVIDESLATPGNDFTDLVYDLCQHLGIDPDLIYRIEIQDADMYPELAEIVQKLWAAGHKEKR